MIQTTVKSKVSIPKIIIVISYAVIRIFSFEGAKPLIVMLTAPV